MSPASLLLPLLLALPGATAQDAAPSVSWKAPSSYVQGLAYEVELQITAPPGGAEIDAWMLTPGAFTVDGKPLGERKKGKLALPAGFTVSGRVDLGAVLEGDGEFTLGYAGDEATVRVQALRSAPADVAFMDAPLEDLSSYRVLLKTNRGDIMVKVWPEVAPQHARNFLDLAATGFYDGTTFHRVIPGFMIQGGDPTGTGSGNGPRTLPLEPSERPHVRGVLSMARAQSPDSASCQFFIMHGNARHLDGQYSAFGEVTSGMDVVDAIATTPTRRGGENSKPLETQRIEKAVVILAPAGEDEEKQ
jgi:cyclophilin family peptidyl-prolyl cis-trans isomerase